MRKGKCKFLKEDESGCGWKYKLFWNEVAKVDDGKGNSSCRIRWKVGLAVGEYKVRRTWKDYFGDLHNMGTQEYDDWSGDESEKVKKLKGY